MANEPIEERVALNAMAGALGAGTALAGGTLQHHLVRGNAAANFGYAATSALQSGATITGALGAGATAMVGGPAVVAAAVAAAPVVLGVAAVGAVAAGVYWLFSDD